MLAVRHGAFSHNVVGGESLSLALQPVTARMLHDARFDATTLHGWSVHERDLCVVEIVGHVLASHRVDDSWLLTIDDGTGRASVRCRNEDVAHGCHAPGSVIRATGYVIGQTKLHAYVVRPVRSGNEMMHHLIHVAWTFLPQLRPAASTANTARQIVNAEVFPIP